MKKLLKRITLRGVLTALAAALLVFAFIIADFEEHRTLALLLAVPAETWLTAWVFTTMSDEEYQWWR